MPKVFTPKWDRVLVVPMERELESEGIILPETSNEQQVAGIVVMVGEGRLVEGRILPLTTKVGDIVLFGIYAGIEIEIEGRRFIVLREEEILGSLQESDHEIYCPDTANTRV